jgi:hypothetical protein
MPKYEKITITNWNSNRIIPECPRKGAFRVSFQPLDTDLKGLYWVVDGKLHRKGKPAIKLPNGDKEYFANGNRLGLNNGGSMISLIGKMAP